MGKLRKIYWDLGEFIYKLNDIKKIPLLVDQEIQRFVGSLNGEKWQTREFLLPPPNIQMMQLNMQILYPMPKVVLIDGMKLAEYVYQYDLGMQTEQTFSIKKARYRFFGILY